MEDFFVVCDNIRSLENIGSIFRTSDALGVTKIFLCGISGKAPVGEPQHHFLERKGVIKTALGAEATIPFEYYKQTWRLIEKLKKEKIRIVSLEQHSRAVAYTELKPTFPLALVVGNEIEGVSKKVIEQSDDIIYLPMYGKKESLNVAVAFGIAGYHLRKF
jgi:tRNA G18 (ribose-2'-O)-methylase SpoU